MIARWRKQLEGRSSVEVTRSKRQRLWQLISLFIGAIILIILACRPHTTPPVLKTPAHLIEVKLPSDALQQWTVQSTISMRSLADTQHQLQKKLARHNATLMQLSATIAQQQSALSQMRRHLQASTHRLTKQQTQAIAALRRSLKKRPHAAISHPHKRHPPKSTPPASLQGIFNRPTTHPLPPATLRHPSRVRPKHPPPLAGWLPMGSFFHAILLNGVEAGTGSHAQSNPQPVLMQITGDAFLPNQAHYRLRACFALGSAYASLSSERAYIRMARIACVAPDGQAIVSEKLHGYAVDSDGKIGLRGHLVSRQGAQLNKAMLAGFFASLSGIGGQSRTLVTLPNISPSGHNALLTSTPLHILSAAGRTGLGSAAKTLADFYINEAKRLFPVIEVSAGRQLTVTISQGVALHWQSVTPTSGE